MYKSGDARNMVRPMETSAWSGEQSLKTIRAPEVKRQEPDSTFYLAQLPSTAVKREDSREQSWKAIRRLKKSFSGTREVRSQEPGAESREQSWRVMRRLKKSLSRTPEVQSKLQDPFFFYLLPFAFYQTGSLDGHQQLR